MMRSIFLYTFYFCTFAIIHAQEINPPENIKTIVFKNQNNSNQQIPILKLGDHFLLEFDDLNADESNYYYSITHCNRDWEPSQLLKSEYLNGLDDQLITQYVNSYGTLQSYTHYQLSLPNDLTSLKLDGNYLLTITNDNGETVFTRRFIIYSQKVLVKMTIKRSQELTEYQEKQVVEFSVKDPNAMLLNPKNTVKAFILQNYRWENAKTNISPKYYLGKELVFKHNDGQTSFWGGNEYLYFENKDIHSNTYGVSQVVLEDIYHTYLFSNTSRNSSSYTYNPDINGDFLIQTKMGEDPTTEADYTWVHFSLDAYDPNLWNQKVYVYGKFSNNHLDEQYQLKYNEEIGKFVGKVLLKQGFYNYKYAVSSSDKDNYNEIGGNFYQTENEYTVLIYYRAPGGTYDQVVGTASLQSTKVTQ